MLRFSQAAVPVGNVPSLEKALTGMRSPLPRMMGLAIFWRNSGASEATAGGRSQELLTFSGSLTSCRFSSVMSIAR